MREGLPVFAILIEAPLLPLALGGSICMVSKAVQAKAHSCPLGFCKGTPGMTC